MAKTSGWGWYYSDNEESFQGPCDSRREAIACGFSEYGGEGTLYIVEACQGEMGCNVFDFDQLLEEFEERNYEHIGEDGQPISNITFPPEKVRQLESRLEDIFSAFMREHGALKGWAFHDTRNAETINMDAMYFFSSWSFCSILMDAIRQNLTKGTAEWGVTTEIRDKWDALGCYQEQVHKMIRAAIGHGGSLFGPDKDYAREQWSKILKLETDTQRRERELEEKKDASE